MNNCVHQGRRTLTLRRLSAAASLLFFCPLPASGATPAGVGISNVASLTFGLGGSDRQVASNAAAFSVAEELGIDLRWDRGAAITVGAGSTTTVPLILTNRGNGQEAFVLTGSVQGLDATVDGFAGATEAGDPQIANGGHTIALAPGAQMRLLVVVGGHGSGQGTLTVAGHALTGFGQPGTSYSGQGDNGVDAVVGPTTAAATLTLPLSVTGTNGAAEPSIVLEKQQAITAPDGSANPIHGAAIRYTLVARADGAGSVADAVVSDPIPVGADYVPGSLTLDGDPLSDSGNIDAAGIAVPLGAITAGQARTITFQVKIR